MHSVTCTCTYCNMPSIVKPSFTRSFISAGTINSIGRCCTILCRQCENWNHQQCRPVLHHSLLPVWRLEPRASRQHPHQQRSQISHRGAGSRVEISRVRDREQRAPGRLRHPPHAPASRGLHLPSPPRGLGVEGGGGGGGRGEGEGRRDIVCSSTLNVAQTHVVDHTLWMCRRWVSIDFYNYYNIPLIDNIVDIKRRS